MNSGIAPTYTYIDSLGLNLWHMYTSATHNSISDRFYPSGWNPDDTLFADSPYVQRVRDTLTRIYSHNNMRSLMQRPKVEWLCYGKRSDYECENMSHVDTNVWFYSFQSPDSIGSSLIDSNKWVKYCDPNSHQPGFVVSRLRANTEQCQRVAHGGNEWHGDSYHNWFIKPRVRIDSAFVQNNPQSNVFRVKVIADNGSTILDDTIRAGNFRDINNPYRGQYIEEYFPAGTHLERFGDWGSEWINKARGNRPPGQEENIADIQIYWFGNCKMWIDYVRVDNDVANDLFSSDTSNQIHKLYEKWLRWEARDIACNDAPLKYYIELSQFNNIPCIAYISNKLKDLTENCGKNINIMTDFASIYSVHVPGEDQSRLMNPEHIKKNYIDKIGATQIFMETYPMTSRYETPSSNSFSKIPTTLPVTNGPGILATPINPEAYDDWLQDNLDYSPYYLETDDEINLACGNLPQDKGNFRYIMQLGNKISKLANIPFIAMLQSHLWFRPCEVRREPTKEEMNMMTNLSVSYGAKGNIFFAYDSWGSLNGSEYSRGLFEDTYLPRDSNVYKQPKWTTIKEIVKRLKVWSPYTMSFDTSRKSYIYRLERNNLLGETFFSDIYTCKPNPSNYSQPSSTAEDTSQRYIQVAKFNNSGEQYSKYFMIVNRRCSPIVAADPGGTNGKRFVKIKLDSSHSDFNGFNNWKIIDLENDTTVVTFNKQASTQLDLGLFLPGQGKIYKLAPVMQEGGTLVTDEVVSGVDFVCKAPVNNGCKNIKITGGSIQFKQEAGINMTKGTFNCSGNCVFAGYNHELWTGIYLRNTFDISSLCRL